MKKVLFVTVTVALCVAAFLLCTTVFFGWPWNPMNYADEEEWTGPDLRAKVTICAEHDGESVEVRVLRFATDPWFNLGPSDRIPDGVLCAVWAPQNQKPGYRDILLHLVADENRAEFDELWVCEAPPRKHQKLTDACSKVPEWEHKLSNRFAFGLRIPDMDGNYPPLFTAHRPKKIDDTSIEEQADAAAEVMTDGITKALNEGWLSL